MPLAGRTRFLGRLVLMIVVAARAAALEASDLKVSSDRIRMDETLSVTVTLEGDYSAIDGIALPLENLAVEGAPSVASQFQWFNGSSSSRKVFRYTVHPLAVGPAAVGPLTLVDAAGKKEVLPRVALEVLPEVSSAADPRQQMRDYASQGKERVVLSAEISNSNPYVGQQVIVTWYLYALESVHGVRQMFAPSLSDFWSEEMPTEEGEQTDVLIDGQQAKKVAIRRVALFPLRSGNYSIGALGIAAGVLRPIEESFGGLSELNSEEVEVRRRSAPLLLNVRPVAGQLTQVGTYTMNCTSPVTSSSGLISFDVTVSGNGNLRAAAAPALGGLAGTVTAQAIGSETRRVSGQLLYQRRWRLLIYPQREGKLHIPAATFRFFDPTSAAAVSLQCGGGEVVAHLSRPASTAKTLPPPSERSGLLRIVVVSLLALSAAVPLALLLVRRRRRQRQMDAILRNLLQGQPDARELRRRLHAWLEEKGLQYELLMGEASDRGEHLRAVVSLIDLRRNSFSDSAELDAELRSRMEELVQAVSLP